MSVVIYVYLRYIQRGHSCAKLMLLIMKWTLTWIQDRSLYREPRQYRQTLGRLRHQQRQYSPPMLPPHLLPVTRKRNTKYLDFEIRLFGGHVSCLTL